MSKNITFYGNSFITTGDKKFGASSLKLDGSGDYVEVSVTNDLDFTNLNYCIETFCNFEALNSGKNTLISKEDYSDYDYKLYYDNDISGLVWDVNGLSSKVSGQVNLNTNQWYHVAATKESGDHRLWLNMTGLSSVSGSLNVGGKTNERLIIGHGMNPHKANKSITLSGETFALTNKNYKHGYKDDSLVTANANIQKELGNGWELASWEDFKDFSESELTSIIQAFGIDSALEIDQWVGWLKKDDALFHFETYKEIASFNRCYFLAFHNKQDQSDFEYFDDYQSKYVALSSWISSLPYIAKKTSTTDTIKDSSTSDFNGYIDGVRISRESFRYSPNYYNNIVPTEVFSNDSNTSLLLDFEGAHQSKEASDLSFTDLTVTRPQIQINSFYPLSGAEGDSIRFSGKALDYVTHVVLSGRRGETLRVPKKGSPQASSRPDYPSFTVDDGTGIYFKLPASVKDNEVFTIKNSNNILSTSDMDVVFESGQSDGKFRITSPRINNFYPALGIYESTVTVEGTRMDGGTRFFFKGYHVTGDRGALQYIPALEVSAANYTGATLKVPREIVSDYIYISGGGEISSSETVFTPLPTVSGIEATDLEIGSTFRVTGINSTEAYPVLFVTGNSSDVFYTRAGQEKSLVSPVSVADVYDLSDLTIPVLSRGGSIYGNDARGGGFSQSMVGDTKLSYSGGCSILTGTVTRNFVGTGNIFLCSYHDAEVGFFLAKEQEFNKCAVSGHITTLTGQSVVVKEAAPSGLGFSPQRGNTSTLISMTGNHLLTVTGLKIIDASFGTSCNITKSEFSNIENRRYAPAFQQAESGVYGVIENLSMKNSYLKQHYINFYPCNLPSGNSGRLYLMSPNYSVEFNI